MKSYSNIVYIAFIRSYVVSQRWGHCEWYTNDAYHPTTNGFYDDSLTWLHTKKSFG